MKATGAAKALARISATVLRQNVYAILDEILESGQAVQVERKGRILRIVPDEVPSKLARLKKHDLVIGDMDDLIHMDWSSEWSELKKA